MAVVYFNVFSCKDASGAIQEAKELRILMNALYVVVYSNYHIVSPCCLSSRQHAPHSQSINDMISFCSFLEVKSLHSFESSMWKDGSNIGSDLGCYFYALNVLMVQDSWNPGVIFGSIVVEDGLFLFETHLG